MPSSPRPVRRLGPGDLKACLALSADREGPAEERKWALLLDAAGGYGIDDPDGGLAEAVVLARYGPGPDPNRRDIASWARARGLPIVNETAFVVHGTPWPPGGARDRLFCPLTAARG